MRILRIISVSLMGISVLGLSACDKGDGGLFGGGSSQPRAAAEEESTIWDLFSNSGDPNTTV